MSAESCLRFGLYRLEGTHGQLWRHTQVVHPPPKATAALWYLAKQPGQLLTREQRFNIVWAGTVVSNAVLTVCVRELCRILGNNPRRPCHIQTVHRRGYHFIAPITTAPQRGAPLRSNDDSKPPLMLPRPAPSTHPSALPPLLALRRS